MLAFYIELFTGEPAKQTPAMTNADHRKFMDILAMEKAPAGMPSKYANKIAIPELNRAFQWLEKEPLWGTQTEPV